MKKTKKVLVSGYLGFGNFGDEAIFESLCILLQSLKFDVQVLSDKNYYEIKTYKRLNVLPAVWNSDIVISGGGSLLQNKTSNESLMYYLGIIFLAKLLGKKVIIFAQGIEPIIGKSYEILTRIALKLSDFVSVRDSNSQKLLKSWHIDSVLTYDPVYALLQDVEKAPRKDGLVVQLRPVKGATSSFVTGLAESVLKYYKGEITVLALQKDMDEAICTKFMHALNKHGAQCRFAYHKSVDDTIDIINQAKYVISTRLHGLICATALGAQTFAIPYDEKVKNFVREQRLQSLDASVCTREELDGKIKKFFLTKEEPRKPKSFKWDKIYQALRK